MGYYTSYTLEMEPYSEVIHQELLREVNEGYDPFEDISKWYDWEEDMRKFSAKFPNHLFHLHGTGDENEDIWTATFKAGKAHIRRATIDIDPYDESKLE